MKIKEQTRKLATGCSKHCFEVADKTDELSHIYTARRRWRGLKRFSKSISQKVSYLTGIHYKHIHTIKSSSNQVESLLKPSKTQLSLEVNLAYDIPTTHEARMISLFVDNISSQVLLK